MSGEFSIYEPYIRMFQQDWIEPLHTGIDKKGTSSLGIQKLNQDWVSHKLSAENGTASHGPANLKVPMTGKTYHLTAENIQKYKAQKPN